MIVYMSYRNENLCIPIILTICLCQALGIDSVNEYARLLEDLIYFTSIYGPNTS